MDEPFRRFRASVALKRAAIGEIKNYVWEYYDSGPSTQSGESLPLVMLPGAGGTADCFFNQVINFSAKGYRVIAAKFPPISDFHEFVSAFERFLDHVQIRKLHLFGTGLGGFLAQVFAQDRPEITASLILCNTFCDSTYFAERSSVLPYLLIFPEFYLKKLLLDNYPKGELDVQQADAVDFMVKQVESLSRQDIIARLTLNLTPFSIDLTRVPGHRVTVIHVFDSVVIPDVLNEQLVARYTDCKIAQLKSGGEFPYLSRSDEFNMMIEIHLRNMGLGGHSVVEHQEQ
eukprot:c4784_g1_i1.p1 GENE.c4784_g1_i1~~c4784_g1_i1.p1  ORF type:complete len:287 (+),score=60.85 c4784_g1_i1:52-912(+)